MKHSNELIETRLWSAYCEKLKGENDAEARKAWLLKVVNTAREYLKAVRDTFPNYTLHDGVHILNIIDCIGGILGAEVEKLSLGEIETIILSAALHDIGMVYSEKDKQSIFHNASHIAKFEEKNSCSFKNSSDELKQDYLRYLHPFRVSEVINSNEVWKTLFDEKPISIVEADVVFEVCAAHGYNASEIISNDKLSYLKFEKTDLRFCSFLLRLADLLDFDDTRAPSVLFGLTPLSETSKEEWMKHLHSAGFDFPEKPTTEALPFKANCSNPNIEHSIREFLRYIDDELANCEANRYAFYKDWQKSFLFPRSISRDGIVSQGYKSDKFSITMDQKRILDIFTGEKLYDNKNAFVRELLQNSMDAVLLRAELDDDFSLDKAKIEIWDWTNDSGMHYFRIDDNGTGMTIDMIHNHFLKVGNSYYTSEELKHDWNRYRHDTCNVFHGISQFGIGFLSCFMCSDNIEVSTSYFDKSKCTNNSVHNSRMPRNNGLRLSITGLTGYYVLRSESDGHASTPMSSYYSNDSSYRTESGTSIVLKIKKSISSTKSLENILIKLSFGANIPIYFNGKKIGLTRAEFQKEIESFRGEKLLFLISDESYKSILENGSFDTSIKEKLSELSPIVSVRTSILTRDGKDATQFMGAVFEIQHQLFDFDITSKDSVNIRYSFKLVCENNECYMEWRPLLFNYRSSLSSFSPKYAEYLKSILDKYESYAQLSDEFEEVLASNSDYAIENATVLCSMKDDPYYLISLWRNSIVSSYEPIRLRIENELFKQVFRHMMFFHESDGLSLYYNGIFAGRESFLPNKQYIDNNEYLTSGVLFLEGTEAPIVNVSRNTIKELPLITWLRILSILSIDDVGNKRGNHFSIMLSTSNTMNEWIEAFNTDFGKNLCDRIVGSIDRFVSTFNEPETRYYLGLSTKNKYSDYDHLYADLVFAFIQLKYDLTMDFDKIQTVHFSKATKKSMQNGYFPSSLILCHSNPEYKQYICLAEVNTRIAINMDHPFVKWLIDNSEDLYRFYSQQFEEIIYDLIYSDTKTIINTVNKLYAISKEDMNEWHNVDFASFVQISENDFWRE